MAGIDGCRAGWVVAVAPVDGAEALSVSVHPSLAEIVHRLDAGTIRAAGIDMPIGLVDGPGGRACDRAARALLGARGVTVFSPPPRAALHAADYAAALRSSRAVTGRGISRQAWNLASRIREVDAAVTPPRRDRLVEVHPEVAFALLAGEPLPPKRTAGGREARLAALARLVPTVAELAARPPRGAAADDVLDALVVWWSTGRFVRGRHRTLGGGVDGRGRPMRIVA